MATFTYVLIILRYHQEFSATYVGMWIIRLVNILVIHNMLRSYVLSICTSRVCNNKSILYTLAIARVYPFTGLDYWTDLLDKSVCVCLATPFYLQSTSTWLLWMIVIITNTGVVVYCSVLSST